MISRSYWPSTRVDIQPSTMPTSAPASFWATGDMALASSRELSLSMMGRSRRWKEATLAWIQPARSVTRARAGPASDTRPVSSATSRSASAVSSAKSGSSESEW